MHKSLLRSSLLGWFSILLQAQGYTSSQQKRWIFIFRMHVCIKQKMMCYLLFAELKLKLHSAPTYITFCTNVWRWWIIDPCWLWLTFSHRCLYRRDHQYHGTVALLNCSETKLLSSRLLFMRTFSFVLVLLELVGGWIHPPPPHTHNHPILWTYKPTPSLCLQILNAHCRPTEDSIPETKQKPSFCTPVPE